MDIHYTLLNPNGNITILVDTPVEKSAYASVAALLMQKEPSCEQVGFVSYCEEECDVSLRMAGGEFCGNATICAAVMWCMKNHIEILQGMSCFVDIGPKRGLVEVDMILLADGSFQAKVSMPLPTSIQNRVMILGDKSYHLPLVRFKGISHFIVESKMSKSTAEKCVKQWAKDLHMDALGLMLLNQREGVLTPLVYVPKSNTLFWENSCASGTTAVGAYLAKISGFPTGITLKEPGGTLRIEAEHKVSLTLISNAVLMKEDTLSIE